MKEQVHPIAATGARRRSTRILEAVPLVISWAGTRAKTLQEKTATLSINCHGCQYFSRFHLRKNTKISVEVDTANHDQDPAPQRFSAHVAWSRKSRRLGGMYQVSIEFETPQNIWEVAETPEDWRSFSPPVKQDSRSLLTELESLLQFAHAGSYYDLLGVRRDSPHSEVKRQFYLLASRFHPDHQMDHPEWTPRLLVLMDALTTAYRTLSDDELKRQYDSRRVHKPQPEPSTPNQALRDCLENSRDCLAEKNFIGSILWLRRAIEIDPGSSTYRTMLGHSLAAVPEYRREAVEQFEKAIELDPSDVGAHFQYAQMLERMNLPWRARFHYIRVLELDTNHQVARERLIRIDSAAPNAASRPSFLRRLTRGR